MYNWTNNLPFGHKQYFLEAIDYFNENYAKNKIKHGEIIKVLEIGTYTGISLINIVKLIPNSIGFGVDRWINYDEITLLENIDELKVESSFYKNIKMEGLEERDKGIKGDSVDILFNMIQNVDSFDFIYVDGSHLAFDCYLDLVQAWKILNHGGLLAIDDYLYNTTAGAFVNSPFEAVNHFLKKYQNEMKILHKGYRVFLIKI